MKSFFSHWCTESHTKYQSVEVNMLSRCELIYIVWFLYVLFFFI